MIKNRPLHVFFVNNPVVHLTSKLIISNLKISESDSLIVNIRNTDCSLLNGDVYPVELSSSIIARMAARLYFNFNTLKLKSFVKSLNREFYVYAAWDYEEVICVSNLPSCLGKYYVEEGQLAYMASGPVAHQDWTWDNVKARPISFKAPYSGGYCLNNRAFPWMHSSKKIVFSDLSPAKDAYVPKLKGITNIGLLPQPHRIPKNKWVSAVNLLAEKVGSGGAIKLHPGFFSVPEWLIEIKKIISMSSYSGIIFCDNSEILELEMLHSRKVFFGARTSIQNYAAQFGSEFNVVGFDGYVPSDLPVS